MKAIIETIDLQMAYKAGKVDVPVLHGVDLKVDEGEFLAIMGPSGCGKSTLLHIIGGLLRPTAGNVFIDGVDITRLNDAERTELRRKYLAYVFQRFNLLPTLTAQDNILLVKRIHSNGFYGIERMREVLDMLGLTQKLLHRPTELSIGEQQRVAIARAILSNRKVILADEPTGSLDSENARMVLRMLQELNTRYNQTIVMITHDADAASMANRIIQMRDGRVLHRVENLFYDTEYEGLF